MGVNANQERTVTRERREGQAACEQASKQTRERERERGKGKRRDRETPNKYDFDDDRPSNSPHFVDVLIPLSL